MFKILMNSGPWGSYQPNQEKKNQEEKKPQDDFAAQRQKQANQDPIAALGKKFKKFVEENFGNSGGNGGSDGNSKNFDFTNKNPKSLIGLVILGIILLWLSLGIYKVDSDENAVVLYFGKYYKTTTPGLNYYIPYPFGQVVKKSVTAVNTEEFGFLSEKSRFSKNRNIEAESLMLTGDENIVDIEFQVQWQIADIKNFVFNVANPNESIRKSAESAMREIIARTPIASALSDGKSKIEQETKILLQEILDYYQLGVRVVLVQLRRVDPPAQVINSFRDVQTAKADKEKEINEAQAYANDIIPRARGEASKILEDAQAYSQGTITNAEGEAARFLNVYKQYLNAKQVTKKRIYLETMEEIYRQTDKILLDKNASKSGVLPYLPLNEIKK
jgi:membrane protease subunit HflK